MLSDSEEICVLIQKRSTGRYNNEHLDMIANSSTGHNHCALIERPWMGLDAAAWLDGLSILRFLTTGLLPRRH